MHRSSLPSTAPLDASDRPSPSPLSRSQSRARDLLANRWLSLPPFLLALLLGRLLAGPPVLPTDPFTHLQQLGLFLIFLAWLISAVCGGAAAARLLDLRHDPLPITLALGSVWMAILASVLGLLGVAGPRVWLIWLALMAAGPLITTFFPSRTDPHASRDPPRPPMTRTERILLLALALLLLLVLASASRLHFFQDPLWYNLVAARYGFDQGRIVFDPTNIAHYHAGLWDAQLLWPNQLLAAPEGRGLLAAHFFGQWLHALPGFAGSALAIYALARRLGVTRPWALLATLAGLTPTQILFTAYLAKNDWGSVLWVLAAFLVILATGARTIRHSLAAGLLLGAAFASKFTTAAVLLPLTLVTACLLLRQRRPRQLACLLLAALLAASPILLRNGLQTGNPFFPAMNKLFPSPCLGPTWQAGLARDFEGGWDNLLDRPLILLRCTDFLISSPLVWLLPLFPLAFWRGLSPQLEWSLHMLGAAFLIFLIAAGPKLENRLFAPGIVLGVILAAAYASTLFHNTRPSIHRLQAPVILLLAALTLFFADVPWKAPLELAASPPPDAQLQRLTGWPSIAWIRTHLPRDQAVIFTKEARTYYLTDFHATRISDNVDLDRQATQLHQIEPIVDLLLRSGYTHMFLDQAAVADPTYFDDLLCGILGGAAWAGRDHVTVHQTVQDGRVVAMVVDLLKLRAFAQSSNATPSPDLSSAP
ncbi:MAG: hypothetical protein IT442_00565 [Phycisphaeraceae bacterium]|nr:hypothetical protein [Phycisphaeraceae bacterium]